MSKTRKERIADIVSDLVSDMLYYDRKEDDDMPVDGIDKAVRDGDITADEIIAMFATHLRNGLTP